MRLIDADALASSLNNGRLEEQTGRAVPFNAGVAFALTMVEYAPTIDAVPVVRCKDCKRSDWYTGANGKHLYYCMEHGSIGHNENDYCSYGERRDDE